MEKELNNAREGMRNFQAGLSCSGGALGPAPVVPVEERVELDLAPRRKRRRESSAWQQGRVVDRRGRWAVDYIIRVRGLEPDEAGWEALVEWKGPFAPSLVREKELCGPAKANARAMADELYCFPKETWPEFAQFFSPPSAPSSPTGVRRRRSARLEKLEAFNSAGSEVGGVAGRPNA